MEINNLTKQELLEKLNEYLSKLERFYHMMAVISYDSSTSCPELSMDENNEDELYLSQQMFALTNDKNYINLVCELHDRLSKEEFTLEEKTLIDHLYSNYQDEKNITKKQRQQFDKVLIEGYLCWLKAKKANDYNLFKNQLREILKVSEKQVTLSARPLESTVFNRIMDNNEKNMSTELLDPFFEKIKQRIIPLLKKVKESKVVIRNDFTKRHIPAHKQVEFSKYLLKTIGYDMNRGSLGFTEHPFTNSLAKNDHRVTTHIFEDNFLSNIYSVIHEGGHGIFGQNIPNSDYDNHIDHYRSLAMDESVSRFFENRIGRSRAFIHLIYPEFKRIFRSELSDVTEEDLYLAANEVKSNLIRTEADELTYSLHIAIRYELEKALFNKEITVNELSKRWNKLYKEYLGEVVSDDAHGVLQDVHWSSGFGYFPTYALGNAYNAMYYNTMLEEFDINQIILNDNIQRIVDYMRDNVFAKASCLDAQTWIKQITKRDFTVDDYLDYLEEKFTEIYKLK